MKLEDKIRCLVVDDEPLARDVIKEHLSKIPFLEFVGECKNALEASSFVMKQQVELIFLDINMPHISGLEFAKQVNPKPAIIFTTAYSEHALEGFELDAIDYLVKPVNFQRFFKSANKALRWFGKLEDRTLTEQTSSKKVSNAFVYLKAEDKMVRIELDSIMAIESQGHYVKIYTEHQNFLIHQSISEMESRLPNHNFIRAHRSFIISLSHVRAYSPAFIETSKVKVPIGRNYKTDLMQALNSKA